jgi:replicative DNA helicase
MTSDLPRSEFINIAAAMSIGMPLWATNLAPNAAVKDGKVVAVFLLEMSNESSRLAGLAGRGTHVNGSPASPSSPMT